MGCTRRLCLLGLSAGLAAPRRGMAQGGDAFNPDALAGSGETLPGDDDAGRLVLAEPPQPLPPITFRDGENRVRSMIDYRGSPALLTFWATWCGPCILETPSLNALAKRLRGKAHVLPLAADRGGAATVDRFYRLHGVDALPVLLDPEMEAAHACRVRGVPTTLLLDGNGRERARLEGGADWTDPGLRTRVFEVFGL